MSKSRSAAEIVKADSQLRLADDILRALGYDGRDTTTYGPAKTKVLQIIRFYQS